MIIVDVPQNSITRDGKTIKCYSAQQFRMLVYLAKANGVVKTPSDIIHNCFTSKFVGYRNVDQALLKLRLLLNDPKPGKIIERVNQVGIRIIPGKVRVIDQNGAAPKAYEGYVFMKYAKMKGQKEPFVVLQSIKDADDWVLVPKAEYLKDIE